jgi:methylglutaconyl-CoA hydratase
MNTNIVLMDVKDSVATITLNRPEVHNAFDEHVIAALGGKLDALHIEDNVQTVVLRGAGKSFSAGADLDWMKRASGFTEQQNKADALALAAMLNKLATLPKTTIACVQGAAMGGGLGLAACCDIVIARDDAVFALSEARLGLIPATIAPYVLRAIGERQARRFFQTGERFKGEQAFALGLVHEVAHSEAELETKLQTILDVLKDNGPKAKVAAKKLCIDLAGKPITQDVMNDTATLIAQTRAGTEAKEGLSAFLEKRKASWVK